MDFGPANRWKWPYASDSSLLNLLQALNKKLHKMIYLTADLMSLKTNYILLTYIN